MAVRLSDVAGNTRIVRDAEIESTHYCDGMLPGCVTFAARRTFVRAANSNPAVVAIITSEEFANDVDVSKGLCVSSDPRLTFFTIHNALVGCGAMTLSVGRAIDSSARLHPSAVIGDNVRIGADVFVDAGAVIGDGVILEESVYVGPNAVVGARGLHDTETTDGRIRVRDAGGVHVKARAEILASAVIQRSYFMEFTLIGSDTVIGPCVNVAHGCVIGDHVLIGGNAQLAGWCRLEDRCWIGPGSILMQKISIAADAKVLLGSVVVKNVGPGATVSGNFAEDHVVRVRRSLKGEGS